MMEYPEKWLENMRSQFPQEYADFAQALEQPACAGLRINPLREYAVGDALNKYAKEAVPWYDRWGRYVRDGKPGADIAHFAGAYYMQEPSAMAAVAALNPRAGELVLDLCAAPGGKSGQIAAAIGLQGALVANEVDADRARMLAGNLERLGIPNASVVCAMPEVLAKKWPETFDAVLCDAPCSGEGMFRRDPKARAEWNERTPEGCAMRQRPILEAAIAMLKSGGRLLYSTCTFNVHENEENVEWLLQSHPEMRAEEFALPGVGRSKDGCIRLWPHKLKGEGHFAALLVKKESMHSAKRQVREQGKGRNRSDPDASLQFSRLQGYIKCDFGRFNEWNPEILQDRLFLVPAKMPDTNRIYCMRRGLPVAKIGRSHMEPEHSLAMALLPDEIDRTFALTEKQTEVWMRGEALSAELSGASGWVWMHRAGLPLGWGKYSDGQIKNKLPKGLWKRV